MRRYFATLLGSAMLFSCSTTVPTKPEEQSVAQHQPDAIDSADWQLVWHDEFYSSSIDQSKWSFEQNCWGGGNDEQQCYTNRLDNAYVDNGVLHIVARKETFTGPALHEDAPDFSPHQRKTLPYTSAKLRSSSKGDWLYGRFEIRAKLPTGQGSLAAITMLPTNLQYGPWPLSGEIAIVEAVNLGTISDEPSALADDPERRIYGTLHYGELRPNNVHSSQSIKLANGQSPADSFHTYAVEWQPGEIRWYVDDVLYATQKSSEWHTGAVTLKTALPRHAPFDQPFHLILNLAVGGNWSGSVNDTGIDPKAFPQSLQIDFVRVYQRQ